MTDMRRRDALGLIALLPIAATLDCGPAGTDRAGESAAAAGAAKNAPPFTPKFFDAHEWRTVRVLADLVIPRDERSGSATDAGVPEFMDFMLTEYPDMQTPIRGGLAWLDAECDRRFGKTFVDCDEGQRTSVLDDIAWPSRARPEMSQGVAFFNRFRDLTASGFWSSRIGVADLQYQGNTFVAEWSGCPESALQKLGVHY
jgi:hypothetical protein